MSRPQTIEVYKFSELDESAKEKAREWYSNGALDYDWWDSVYEDAGRIFDILGIVSQKPVKLMGGGTRYEPCIWFSGFCSQGDGACFEGSYSYAKGSAKAIREYAPLDTVLHEIADTLVDVQRRNFYRLTARISHSGRYYHEYSVSIDVENSEGFNVSDDDAETVAETLRDLMRWIYRALELEHDWLLNDETVDENIEANEYEFYEDGNRA